MNYETEEQQVEALKSWWAENGRAVLAGIVLGAAAIGGWGFWQKHRAGQAVAASEAFSQTMAAMRSTPEQTSELADRLIDDHPGTLYAGYAQLAAALAAVETNDLDGAAARLQWVVDEVDQDDIAVIAAVRLARVRGALGDSDAGLAVLPDTYPEAFTGLVEEVRGDLHVANGDPTAARAAYERAQRSQNVADRAALTMKLSDLAPVDAS